MNPERTVIAVNVTSSWSATADEKTKLESLEGDWPIHGHDLDRLLNANGGLLVGCARSRMVAIRLIDSGHVIQDEQRTRVRFTTRPAPDYQSLIGQPVPLAIKWRPGQGWPVKVASVDDLPTVAAAIEAVVMVDVFRVVLTVTGELHVTSPPGRVVRVISK